MKKAIVLVVLFAILAITFTATMINIKKADLVQKPVDSQTFPLETDNPTIVNNTENPIPTKAKSNEKTIDLYSTYNENDLIISTETIDNYNEVVPSMKVYKISGLKDKTIEKKINDDILNVQKEYIDKLCQNEGIEDFSFWAAEGLYSCANFGNVVSMSVRFSYNIGDCYYNDNIGFNYDLVSGNRLSLSDLFTEDTSIKDLYRIALYKKVAEEEELVGFGTDDFDEPPFYNEELGIFQNVRHLGDKEEIIDYVPTFDEYEIEKYVNKEYSQNNFSFNSTAVLFKFGQSYAIRRPKDGGLETLKNVDLDASIGFREIADKVVIYDKYKTKESIFENDNIGRKNILTCSADLHCPKEKQTIFKSDNYFYDYTPFLAKYTYTVEKYGYDTNAVTPNSLVTNINAKMQEIIDKYDKESKENKDTAYFLFLYPLDGMSLRIDESTEEMYFTTKLIKCDIKDKYKVMDELFDGIYRYYNIGFYGETFYNEIEVGNANDKNEYAFLVECNSATMEKMYYFYDLATGQYIYEDPVKKIEIEDYDYCTVEDLNHFYNEIFARHGHDFKSQELKDYFSQFYWYRPIPGKTVSLEELSPNERYNLDVLKQLISEK